MIADDDIIEDPPLPDPQVCADHLRSYQSKCYYSVAEGWKKGFKRQLVIQATGTGKTVLMGEVANNEVNAWSGRVMMLAHTDEILDQAIDKFSKASRLDLAKEKAGERASRHDKVVVASVQTMRQLRRLQEYERDAFSLIMVDEAHRSLAKSYQDVLAYFNTARVLGVTATADRGDKKELGTYFERIAIDYGLRAACKDAWLVRPMVQTVPLKFDMNNVKSRGGDLDQGEVAHVLEPFLLDIAKEIRTHAAHLKTVIFMPSIDTARKLSLALVSVGMTASFVSGECSDRKEKLAAYSVAGAGAVICNAMLLTEGWDDPETSCVVCLRPTKIRALYTQMVGRGTRPHPDIVLELNAAADADARSRLIRRSKKPRLTILDFLWIYEKHDLCRPASLISKNPEQFKKMRELGDGDLLDHQERAEVDELENLKKEMKKNSDKRAKLIDPLTAAVELGDPNLVSYEPITARDALPPSAPQLAVLEKHGINPTTIRSWGLAEEYVEAILHREEQGLATLRQLNFFKKLGTDASLWTQEEATKEQRRIIGNWHHRGRRN